jgi:NAD(P)-dependent dehydrogenase (short-subunit alcohol dehydrogenase family)
MWVGGDMPDVVYNDISNPLRVLVTGGTGTLGEAVLLAFAKGRHQTYFQYFRNDRSAARLADTLGAIGFKIDFSRDFTVPVADFDVLVNCAGINISREQAHTVDPEVWDRMLRVNVTAPFLLSQAVLPGMLKRGWGRIINVGSIYSLRGAINRAPYVASKHAAGEVASAVLYLASPEAGFINGASIPVDGGQIV